MAVTGAVRAFIAVELPENIKGAIGAASHGLSMPGVSVTHRENLHITFAFLGSVSSQTLEDVVMAVSAIDLGRFSVSVEGFGVFDPGNPKIVYARICAGAAELSALNSRVMGALSDVGMSDEGRAYVPHITVARVRRRLDRPAIERLEAAFRGVGSLGAFEFQGLSIMRSDLASGGPTYTKLGFISSASAPKAPSRTGPR